MSIKKIQPASALLITLMVLGGVFIIAFGAAYLVFFNTKAADSEGQSTKAYYSSFSGLERLRYERRKTGLDIKNCGVDLLSGTLHNTSTYQIDCDATSSAPGKIVSRGLLSGFEQKFTSNYCFDITIECDPSCAVGSICGGGTLLSLNPNLVVAPSNNTEAGCVGGATCAAVDSAVAAYAATSTLVSATSVDDGRNNISAIITAAGSLDDYPAAKACDELSLSGFGDWYLPASDELNLMLRNSNYCEDNVNGPVPQDCLNGSNHFYANLNGFSLYTDYYWSSTEYDITAAWRQYFSMGKPESSDKTQEATYRCIRRF